MAWLAGWQAGRLAGEIEVFWFPEAAKVKENYAFPAREAHRGNLGFWCPEAAKVKENEAFPAREARRENSGILVPRSSKNQGNEAFRRAGLLASGPLKRLSRAHSSL